ncbi:hypothetical protein SAMN02745132_04138 [Enterovibrio nigricans DSM 22720]|uniref:Uncharacterized protein n=1 Tax=Enterovibrio nigricans DSM 22720 TaxID=1121868 RepID=A0A1T4VQH2_9GAMM|nr:hypothetical protein SAMN02745132_04138 [Enterovibrio nigricans DSM 22720]
MDDRGTSTQIFVARVSLSAFENYLIPSSQLSCKKKNQVHQRGITLSTISMVIDAESSFDIGIDLTEKVLFWAVVK